MQLLKNTSIINNKDYCSIKNPTNISFIKGSCFGAGIALISISIMAYEDPPNLMGVPFVIPVGAILCGLTSYIVPQFRKTKTFLI